MFLSVAACSIDSQNHSEGTKGSGDETENEIASILEGDIAGEITVSSYDSTFYKSYLEEAAIAFEAKYPGTKVTIDTFSQAPDVKTDGKGKKVITSNIDQKSQDDYISRVNTELMTGEGADVLAMDILPYYKYADNGQIEDLRLYMEQDKTFNQDQYRQNILEAVRYKGGQYIFPLDYSFDFISYDKTLLQSDKQSAFQPDGRYSYEQLIEMGQSSFTEVNTNHPPSPVKMFSLFSGAGKSNSIFNQLFTLDYDDFVDIENRTANFKDGTFVNLLEKAKEYEEEGYLNISTQNGKTDMSDVLRKNASQEYIYKIHKDPMLLQAFDDSNKKKSIVNIGGSAIFEEDDAIAGILQNNENEIAFDFTQAYALNSHSDNKKTAWEFIKFLASEEIQTSFNLVGRPINNKANEEKSKLQMTGELYASEKNTDTLELNEEQTKLFHNYMDAINKYSNMLNTYMLQDTVINQMVNAEVKYFFDGSKSADDVANILQNRVELYLHE